MRYLSNATALAASLLVAAACNPEQQDRIDSVAGAAESSVRAALSVIDIDMGRHADTTNRVTDETDTFAASDTIFASVQTSGTAEEGTVVARWTFPDGSVINQTPDQSAARANRLVFFISKPGGLPSGSYKFQILVDDREVRSTEVSVRS